MLQEVEALAAQLYGSATSNEQRAEAERQLSVFSSNPEMLDQARMILETSQQPYAQHLASSAMSKLLTANWGRFSAQQRLDMRQYAVTFLASKGPALEGFVCAGLVSLLARITKLGWFENPSQDITKDVNQFLTVSIDHCIIGLQIYNELVSEMNVNKTGLPLAIHRKKSVSFRDKSLLQIFQVAMQTLSQLLSGSYGQITVHQDAKLREQCLKLTLACLSYDFFGTSSDETTEDVGTVQVPTNWRSLIEDQNTMATLLQAYNTSAAPRSAQAMECLSQLASVRRSLFPNQEARQAFLQRVLTAVVAVLRGQQRLGEEDNFHEFCRLLSRVKANFQLGEMIKCGEVYQELIQLVAQFTVQSLQSCPFASNSVYYLLQLWSRMVTSVAYLKGEGESNLDRYVPEVTRTYIISKLQAAQQLLRESPDEDPMENEEQLVDQLDSASPLCRYQYDRTAEFLLSLFDPLLAKLQALATQGPVAAGGSNQAEIQVVEGELAWLVYIIGAVVGARGTSRTSEEHEQLDGDLCARVFQTIQWVEMRQPAQGSASLASPTLQRLELSLLYFFQYFRKAYIGEQANVSSPKLYQRLAERVGVSDNLMVMNVIVNKMMSNLKVWSRHEEIVDKSLLLFHELASGYSSSKTLSKLEVVTFTLRNHGPQQLPFLNESGNPRHRTVFYTTLTRILLMDDQGHMEFEHFMAPFTPVLQHLKAFLSNPASAGPGPARDEARALLMGVLRDLRGVCVGTPNRRAYVAFFDWLYPDYLPMFVRAAEIWWNDSAVTTPLLKFVAELVHNKCQRIAFDCSSPNGILLFREASRLLVTYGQHILTGAPPTYKDKYKGVSICLQILSRALSGGYCNLGVFQLYGDSALSEALNIVLQLSLSIPVNELMAYPKVMRGYFPLQEILCHNHMSYLCLLESPVFIQIVSNIQYGLKWVNPPHDISVSSECASALYHIVEFRFRGSKKEVQALAALQSHIEANPQMFGQLLALLLETVVYDDCPNQWALSRPMLGLILTNEEAYEQIKRQMIEALAPDRRGQMEAAFDKLMTGVQRNLESRNRDKFTQNLTAFRQEVKAFLNA